MNMILRVKKYLKSINLGSPAMNPLAPCSIGRRIPTPKLRAAPAPSCPAAMMPGPAPVITIHPREAIDSAKSRAVVYVGSPGSVRAEPNMLTFRVSRYGAKMRNARPSSRIERLTSFISPRFAVRAVRNIVSMACWQQIWIGDRERRFVDEEPDLLVERAVAGTRAAPHALPRRRRPRRERLQRLNARHHFGCIRCRALLDSVYAAIVGASRGDRKRHNDQWELWSSNSELVRGSAISSRRTSP